MATVYLPLGYPILNESFSTIIYQGHVARVYNLAEDPRTVNQLSSRKLLSDVAKMRGAAGSWVKSGWKILYGSKWATIMYQMVKADVDNYWTLALDEFDTFSAGDQQGWRDNAPFEVTFNDPGKIFFALSKMLYQWDEVHEGHIFYQPEPVSDAYESAGVWWLKDVTELGWQYNEFFSTFVDDQDLGWQFTGTWADWFTTGPWQGTLKIGQTPGGTMVINVVASRIRLRYSLDSDGGPFKVFMDGAEAASLSSNGTLAHNQGWDDIYRPTQQREVKIEHTGSGGQEVYIDGFWRDIFYLFPDVDFVGGSWASYVVSGIPGSDGYESTGGGGASLEFNVNCAWLSFVYKAGPSYGVVDVWVDGELFTSVNQNEPTVTNGRSVLIGRFRFGLHHIKLVQSGAQQITFGYVIPGKSKSTL